MRFLREEICTSTNSLTRISSSVRIREWPVSGLPERFTFEESCRLEQTALLLAPAQELLKERRVVFPAESALLRLVGEQKSHVPLHP
jgi:hypothetical protein